MVKKHLLSIIEDLYKMILTLGTEKQAEKTLTKLDDIGKNVFQQSIVF